MQAPPPEDANTASPEAVMSDASVFRLLAEEAMHDLSKTIGELWKTSPARLHKLR